MARTPGAAQADLTVATREEEREELLELNDRLEAYGGLPRRSRARVQMT